MRAKQKMRPCYHVEIITPKKYVLNGLWFGPKKAKQVIIFIHGLTGSAFSMKRMVDATLNTNTAVMTFNNRGFEHISEVKRKRGRESVWERGGGGHEIFTTCADDIQGAINAAKRTGVKKIYLAGHSTGCQKSIYYASRNPFRTRRVLNGFILLGPLSDYAIAVEQDRRGGLKRSIAHARKLVRTGKPHALMPAELGPWFVCDAQRFLSLYTPDSAEEIFPYAQSKKNPRALRAVRVPILVVLADKEEHTKRPAKQIAAWFDENIRAPHRVVIVPKVGHSFKGAEKQVAGTIHRWIKAQ